MLWNRNKRSICIDLRSSEGMKLLHRLIASADVFMENYRSGVADKMGLGYEALRALNPRLIYCSINAFGSKGPWRGVPGTDPVVQAMSGVMSVTGERAGPPVLVGYPVADYTSAMVGVQGILLALAARERTGEGQRVEISMLASLVFGLTTRVAPYFLTGKNPERFGSEHSQVVPYQAFKTADGTVVAGVWGRGWEAFCDALALPDLGKDARFLSAQDRVTNRQQLTPILEAAFASESTKHWERRFRERGVLFSPVNSLSDVLESDQSMANELTLELEHPTAGRLRQVAPPIKMSATPGAAMRPPPLLGQHTRELLHEIGLSDEEVDRLSRDGVIAEQAIKGASIRTTK